MKKTLRTSSNIYNPLSIRYLFGLMLILLYLVLPSASFAQEPGFEPGMGMGEMEEGEMRRHMRKRMREGREGKGGKGDGRRIMKMKRFLNFVSELHSSVKEPPEAAGFAALAIKNYHKKKGQPLQAVSELEEALKATKNQQTRNILLFTIRQVYEDSKNHEKVYEVSKRLLKENAK